MRWNHPQALLTGVPAALLIALALLMLPSRGVPRAIAAQAPSCTVGSWVTNDLQSLAQTFSAFDASITVSELQGELRLTIAPDGAYTAEYTNVQFTASISGFTASGTLNGSITGTYTDAGDGTVIGTVSDGNINFTISVLGLRTTQNVPVPAIEPTPTTYQCSGDQLTIALVAADPAAQAT